MIGNSRKKGCLFPGLLLSLPVGLVLIYLGLLAAGSFLVEADSLRKVDALVVLSGGGPERLATAARLYKQGIARRVILTEIGTRSLVQEASRAGIADGDLITGRVEVSSTAEEARAVQDLMKKYGLQTCIIVTDPFHTQRARFIFRQSLVGEGFWAGVYPSENHWYRPSSWMWSWEGWQVTLLEFGKLLAFVGGIADE